MYDIYDIAQHLTAKEYHELVMIPRKTKFPNVRAFVSTSLPGPNPYKELLEEINVRYNPAPPPTVQDS